MTDQQLLERLRAGEEDAFDALFRANYPALVRLAESMLHQRAVAEEIAQDVLLELWRRRESLAIEESVRAYLFRATRNRSLNHLRHEKVIRRSEPYLAYSRSETPSAAADLAEHELEAAIREAVLTLPDRCREVFELSRGHGLKYAEIATTLGISVKTVEAQMGKALRLLRDRLAPWLTSAE